MVPPLFFRMQKRKSLTGAVKLNKTALIGRKCFQLSPRTFKVTRFDKEQFWMCTFEFFPIFKIREIQS